MRNFGPIVFRNVVLQNKNKGKCDDDGMAVVACVNIY